MSTPRKNEAGAGDGAARATVPPYRRLRDFGAFQIDVSMLDTREVAAAQQEHLADTPTNKVASILPSSLFESDTDLKKPYVKKYLSLVLRAGLTLLLFVILLRSLSWGSLFAALEKTRRALIVMGLIIGAAGVVISSYQWRSLLQGERIHFDLADLIDLYLVGTAFSHFLPTGMGGDAIKALYVGRRAGNTAGSTSAVVMSRVTGFFAMLVIATAILLVLHSRFTPGLILGFVLLSLLVGGMIAGAILSVTLLPWLFRGRPRAGRLIPGKVRSPIVSTGNALKASVTRPRSMMVAFVFGILFWIIACMNYYSYAIATGVNVPLYFYLVAIPFVSLVTFLPVSINGFGLRESAFVYLFSTMHVAPASSLLIVLLMDAQVICFGIIGGCIYFMLNRKKDLEKISHSSFIVPTSNVPEGQ